jgi:hypothetical protein
VTTLTEEITAIIQTALKVLAYYNLDGPIRFELVLEGGSKISFAIEGKKND